MAVPMRTRDELKRDFQASGESDYLAWLKTQPEGDRGSSEHVTVAAGQEAKRTSCCQEKPTGSIKATAPQMAVSAAKAAARFAFSGFKTVDDATYQKRWQACLACEHLLAAEKEEHRRCALCGCFMKFKTKLPAEKCRAGKW